MSCCKFLIVKNQSIRFRFYFYFSLKLECVLLLQIVKKINSSKSANVTTLIQRESWFEISWSFYLLSQIAHYKWHPTNFSLWFMQFYPQPNRTNSCVRFAFRCACVIQVDRRVCWKYVLFVVHRARMFYTNRAFTHPDSNYCCWVHFMTHGINLCKKYVNAEQRTDPTCNAMSDRVVCNRWIGYCRRFASSKSKCTLHRGSVGVWTACKLFRIIVDHPLICCHYAWTKKIKTYHYLISFVEWLARWLTPLKWCH